MKKIPYTLHTSLVLISLIAANAQANGLRPLAADRPDSTESPYSVDQGHWQIETSLLSYARDRDEKFERWEYLNTNLKYGLSDQTDLQIVFTPWREEIQFNQRKQGTSDLELRLKINLWGQTEASESALALLPYIKIPRGLFSNEKWEAGFITTYGLALEQIGLGTQIQVDRVWDETQHEYAWEFGHTLVASLALSETLGTYLEYISEWDTEGAYFPYASGGVTYQINANRQWDIGTKKALNSAGQDEEIFIGITQRF